MSPSGCQVNNKQLRTSGYGLLGLVSAQNFSNLYQWWLLMVINIFHIYYINLSHFVSLKWRTFYPQEGIGYLLLFSIFAWQSNTLLKKQISAVQDVLIIKLLKWILNFSQLLLTLLFPKNPRRRRVVGRAGNTRLEPYSIASFIFFFFLG